MKFWYQIIYFAGLRARQLTKSTERLLNLNRWRCWLLLIHKNQNKTLSWREREGSLIKVWWVDTVGNVVVLINRPQTTNMTKSNSKPAGLDHSKYLVPCWLVQSLSRVQLFAAPETAARPPCPSPIPRVYPNTCPSSQWCHPAISSSVIPFSSCPQSLPASVFSNESTLRMKWPKYWTCSISPSNEHPVVLSI